MTSADELARSYDWCYRVARDSGSSFYRAFWLLDRPQRSAMFALYAFSRITDDLSDAPCDLETRSANLRAWQALLSERLPQSNEKRDDVAPLWPAHSPERGLMLTERPAALAGYERLWPALAHAVKSYRIPVRLLQDLVAGVAMDLQPVRLPDWPAVDRYCYHVASTVGLACTSIWQAANSLPKGPAIDCGLAFQLTNILRDLREDAARDRIYLPIVELEKYGCDSQSWLAGAPRGDWLELVASVIERTRTLYSSGAQTIDHLPPRGARMFWLMWSNYRQLLEAIDRQKEHLWSDRRVRLSRPRRFRLLIQSLVVPTNSTRLRLESN